MPSKNHSVLEKKKDILRCPRKRVQPDETRREQETCRRRKVLAEAREAVKKRSHVHRGILERIPVGLQQALEGGDSTSRGAREEGARRRRKLRLDRRKEKLPRAGFFKPGERGTPREKGEDFQVLPEKGMHWSL